LAKLPRLTPHRSQPLSGKQPGTLKYLAHRGRSRGRPPRKSWGDLLMCTIRTAVERLRHSTVVLIAVVCCSASPTLVTAQSRCVSFSDTIDGINKNRAVEKSLKSLGEQIEKWKAENRVTGSVTVIAQKPQPRPFWRSSVPAHALLPPDIVSQSAHTICWTGVVSPVVCTSSSRLCW
jgi:hypothetical protein